MASICCPGDLEHDCSPTPQSCSAECAQSFLEFYAECTIEVLDATVVNDLQTFKQLCATSANATDTDDGGRRLLQPRFAPTLFPQHALDENQHRRRQQQEGDSCVADFTFVDEENVEMMCPPFHHSRWQCVGAAREATLTSYRWVLAIIIVLELGVAAAAYKLREAVANRVHSGATNLWGAGGRGPAVKGLEMSTYAGSARGGSASAADFYASQTKTSGVPKERQTLEPTHPMTGKRQMQMASAPNSIARVRCIFERFAVDVDGQKVLNEEAFSKYTVEVGAVRPALGEIQVPPADLAKRYKLIVRCSEAIATLPLHCQSVLSRF